MRQKRRPVVFTIDIQVSALPQQTEAVRQVPISFVIAALGQSLATFYGAVAPVPLNSELHGIKSTFQSIFVPNLLYKHMIHIAFLTRIPLPAQCLKQPSKAVRPCPYVFQPSCQIKDMLLKQSRTIKTNKCLVSCPYSLFTSPWTSWTLLPYLGYPQPFWVTRGHRLKQHPAV